MVNRCLSVLCLLATFPGILSAQESDFELKVSGVLVNKLAQDTQLHLWNPYVDESDWVTFELAELPRALPFDQFKDRNWYVEFVSKSARSQFSVSLSADLFDEPRIINVKLDVPRPGIRPIGHGGRQVRYSASITRRMEYRDLPQWDARQKSLTQSRPPRFTIKALSDGQVIHDQKMNEECGAKWYSMVDHNFKFREGEVYRMSVTYDSGGLFPVTTTTNDFRYQPALHGD